MNASKKRLMAVFLALVLLLVLTTPALADPRIVTGEWISLFADPPVTEFPANSAFFMAHTSCTSVATKSPPMTGHEEFTLDVDGKLVEESFEYSYPAVLSDGLKYICSGAAFNFPQGLAAGLHTFTGHFFVACKSTGVPCDSIVEPYEWLTKSLAITFFEP